MEAAARVMVEAAVSRIVLGGPGLMASSALGRSAPQPLALLPLASQLLRLEMLVLEMPALKLQPLGLSSR